MNLSASADVFALGCILFEVHSSSGSRTRLLIDSEKVYKTVREVNSFLVMRKLMKSRLDSRIDDTNLCHSMVDEAVQPRHERVSINTLCTKCVQGAASTLNAASIECDSDPTDIT